VVLELRDRAVVTAKVESDLGARMLSSQLQVPVVGHQRSDELAD